MDSSTSNTKHCHSNFSIQTERLSISHATTPPTLLVLPQTINIKHQTLSQQLLHAHTKAKHFPQYHITTHMIFQFHHTHLHHTLSQLLHACTKAKHFPQCHITTHMLFQFHHGLSSTPLLQFLQAHRKAKHFPQHHTLPSQIHQHQTLSQQQHR